MTGTNATVDRSELAHTLRAMKQAGIAVKGVEVRGHRIMITAAVAESAIPTSGWLRVRQACAYVPMGRSKLYELITLQKVKIKKFGNRTLISKQSLDRYLASLKNHHLDDERMAHR